MYVLVLIASRFAFDRILGLYMNEAGNIAMEGNDIETIDKALLDFGMPMGPFRLMDEVGTIGQLHCPSSMC